MRKIIFVLVLSLFSGISCGCSTDRVMESSTYKPTAGKITGFEGKSGHTAKGTAAFEPSGKGWRVVFNEDFEFDGAPAPIVALGKDGYRKETMLGELKANSGRQFYEIPDGLDIEKFNEVWLWCTKYDVPLGVAKVSK